MAGALASGDDGAILFNGSTGVVRMGDVLDITAGSYELWIKRSNTTAALQYIMDKGPGQPNIALRSDHSIYVGEENVWWLSSTVTINDTNWHHIVFTHPGGATSGLAKLYIDGVDRTLTLGGANLVANASNLSVGAGYGDFLHFAGTIDEVALYGRALTQAEVADHFQAGRNGTGPSLPKTLDGAILRVDPATGAAAAGNPNASSTDPNVRRIIAHGLRNPFRITTRPGTNELWVGDVGWTDWEEINRIPAGGDAVVENFGWPCYEGVGRQSGYDGANLTLCESLYSQGAGAVTAPLFTYNHANKVVPNETCPSGSSSISGLAFYPESGGSFPASYRGGLFFSDYSRNCIWFMAKGSNGLPDPATRQTFVAGAAGPVDLVIGPNGDLFYPDFNGGTIRRVSPIATQSPTARIVAVPTSGTAPLSVAFDGTTSTDPGNLALTYAWDLDGDGALDDSTAAAPTWQYTQPGRGDGDG